MFCLPLLVNLTLGRSVLKSMNMIFMKMKSERVGIFLGFNSTCLT